MIAIGSSRGSRGSGCCASWLFGTLHPLPPGCGTGGCPPVRDATSRASTSRTTAPSRAVAGGSSRMPRSRLLVGVLPLGVPFVAAAPQQVGDREAQGDDDRGDGGPQRDGQRFGVVAVGAAQAGEELGQDDR